MKKINYQITKLFLVSITLLLSACAFMSVEAKSSCANNICQLSAGKMLVTYQKVSSNTIKVTMSAPTTGWVAVGFGATFAMKNAYMVIAYIDEQGKVQVSEEYGTGAWSHSSIKSMGGQSQISQVTGSYDKNTNTTTISFEMPLASKDKKYGKVLTKGKEVTIIMAYGKDGAKNFTNHHQFRASKTIKNFSI